MILQIVDRAIPIFEATHPKAIAVFAFDNSTSHGTFSSDAFIANRMNVRPGGKQLRMKNTHRSKSVKSGTYQAPD